MRTFGVGKNLGKDLGKDFGEGRFNWRKALCDERFNWRKGIWGRKYLIGGKHLVYEKIGGGKGFGEERIWDKDLI